MEKTAVEAGVLQLAHRAAIAVGEDRLRAVTPAEASAAFRKYIDPEKMSFVIAGDAKKGVK